MPSCYVINLSCALLVLVFGACSDSGAYDAAFAEYPPFVLDVKAKWPREICVNMYFRTIKRTLKDGFSVSYAQLEQEQTDPKSGETSLRILHDFGRLDKGSAVYSQLLNLCRSIAGACGHSVVSVEENSAGQQELLKNRSLENELNNEIRQLKIKNSRLSEKLDKIEREEKKLRTVFNNVNDEIVFVDKNGKIIEVNEKCVELFGYSREEAIGKPFTEFPGITSVTQGEILADKFELASGGGGTERLEFQGFRRDGTSFFVDVSVKTLYRNNEIEGIIAIIRDIADRKKAENELHNYRNQLEDLVKERTEHLNETNIALKVMLRKEGEIKEELNDKILFNVKELIFPYIEKLKKSAVNSKQLAYIEIIANNLNTIISPFVSDLPSGHLHLTPTEIQVANMIKQGKSSKEIADLLNMSCRTVDTHRHNMRKKIGIGSKKTNLRSWLLGQ